MIILLGVVVLQQNKQTSYLSNQASTAGETIVSEESGILDGAVVQQNSKRISKLCGVVRTDGVKGVGVRALWSGFERGEQVSGTIRLMNFRYVNQNGQDEPIDAVQVIALVHTPNLFPITATIGADGTGKALGQGLIVKSGFHWGQPEAIPDIPESSQFMADVAIEDLANNLRAVYPNYEFFTGNEQAVNQACGF